MNKKLMLKGFTLAELMIAVVIVGILSSLAVPRFISHIEKTRTAEAVANLEAVYKLQLAYFQEKRVYAGSLSNLDITIPPSAYFLAPTVSTADPIVSIERNNNSYTLTISPSGTLSCTPAGAACDNLGF